MKKMKVGTSKIFGKKKTFASENSETIETKDGKFRFYPSHISPTGPYIEVSEMTKENEKYNKWTPLGEITYRKGKFVNEGRVSSGIGKEAEAAFKKVKRLKDLLKKYTATGVDFDFTKASIKVFDALD